MNSRSRSASGSFRRCACAVIGVHRGQLHHEVAVPAGDAAIEQANDVRMLERGQDLPLADEAVLGLGARQTSGCDLDRDVLGVFAVAT